MSADDTAADWRPGDFAMVKCSDNRWRPAACCHDSAGTLIWLFKGGGMRRVDASTARPAAVIDDATADPLVARQALAEALFVWNSPTDPYFVIHGGKAGLRIGEGEDSYLPIADAVLDHLAGRGEPDTSTGVDHETPTAAVGRDADLGPKWGEDARPAADREALERLLVEVQFMHPRQRAERVEAFFDARVSRLRSQVRRVCLYAMERRTFWAQRDNQISAARAVAYQSCAGMLHRVLDDDLTPGADA